MKRRKFMKTSLLAAGSALLPASCTSKKETDQPNSFFQTYNVPQQLPPGKLKVQYIREKIPAFEVAAVKGVRYDDSVPDTLDIAERAKLGINSLTSIADAQRRSGDLLACRFLPESAYHGSQLQ